MHWIWRSASSLLGSLVAALVTVLLGSTFLGPSWSKDIHVPPPSALWVWMEVSKSSLQIDWDSSDILEKVRDTVNILLKGCSCIELYKCYTSVRQAVAPLQSWNSVCAVYSSPFMWNTFVEASEVENLILVCVYICCLHCVWVLNDCFGYIF